MVAPPPPAIAPAASVILFSRRTRRKLWNTPAGPWVSGLQFESDGKAILAVTAGSLTKFDVISGRAGRKIISKVGSANPPAFSPQNNWLAVGANSAARLWHLLPLRN